MKELNITITAVFLLLQIVAFGQIKGETRDVSVLTFPHVDPKNTSGRSDYCSTYDDGLLFDYGHYLGELSGAVTGEADGNKCLYNEYNWYDDIPNIQEQYEACFLDGFEEGWSLAYAIAYQEIFDNKVQSCEYDGDHEFDEFFCECRCISKEYYFDKDGDNYYDPNWGYIYDCSPPSSSWKLLDDLLGSDCDDSNKLVWSYNDCGVCSAESGITTWYYYGDLDNYYGDSEESCSRPTSGNPNKWSRSPGNGPDCDDTDDLANIAKSWYYFGDSDNYYGQMVTSCLRPTSGDRDKWKPNRGSGEDCDDTDPDIVGELTRYYDYDGDGYYGQEHTSCFVPESWDPDRWSTNPGSGRDCDDRDKNKTVQDECGVCGGDGSTVAYYLDMDGDGYYSMFLQDVCKDFVLSENSNGFTISINVLENVVGFPAFKIPPEDVTIIQEFKHEFPVVYENGVKKEELTIFVADEWIDLLPDGEYHKVLFPDWDLSPYLRVSKGGFSEDYEYLNILTGEDQNLVERFITRQMLGVDCDDLDPNVWSGGEWYRDMDEDGYHNTDIIPISMDCKEADRTYILLAASKGADCDDTDKWANSPQNWYYSGDGDYYHDETKTQFQCENPAKGTSEESKWQTDPGLGPDCDDTDPNATVEKDWYSDFDEDGFYGYIIESVCENPGNSTGELHLWKTDSGLGEDCDDANPNVATYNACGVCGGTNNPVALYVDLDGDGYHSLIKIEDCGLPVFDGEVVRGSSFPESLLPTEEEEHISIPGTSLSIHYIGGETDEFTFPAEVLSYATLGLDCDDLDAAVRADGEWYPDRDHDGYHDASVLPFNSCSPPDVNSYILLSNSKGEDCNDDDIVLNTIKTWYLDVDGDGYYTDTQESCEPPGFHWSLTASIGFDNNDTDPYSPAMIPIGLSDEFIIPSLLKEEINELGDELISYNGNTYDPDKIKIFYRGVYFYYSDIIFDRVNPTVRLLPDKLVIGYGAPLYGAQIIIDDPVATSERTENLRVSMVSNEQDSRVRSEWMNAVVATNEGYSSIVGDVKITVDNESYFSELFTTASFQKIKDHYQTYGGPEFAFEVRTYEEKLSFDLETGFKSELQPIINEKIGEGNTTVIFTAKKTADGRMEYVVSTHEDSFKATDNELQTKGWKNASNEWLNPGDEELYRTELAEVAAFRDLMIGMLVVDHDMSSVITPTPPDTEDLEEENYPEYDFGKWGLLTKWVEFLEVTHHLGHKFEMPKGTWNPDAEDNEWERWRLKSPSSLAGIIDRSIEDIKDLAEMIKLGQSLCHKEAWVQILESLKDFDIGDQVSGMFSSFKDSAVEVYDELTGVYGEYRQYYQIGRVTVNVLSNIYSSWKSIGKGISKITSTHPKATIDKRNLDFNRTFKSVINKSPEFSSLSKNLQDKLVKDLAEDADDVFAKALAKDSKLIKSWERIENSAKRATSGGDAGKILRKDVASLKAIAKFDDDLISKIGSDKFDDFMDNVMKANPKCMTCGNLGKTHMGNLNEIYADFYTTVTKRIPKKDNGDFIDSFGDFMKEAAEQPSKAKGAVFILKKLSRNIDDFEAGGFKLSDLEINIPNIDTGHRLDLIFKRTIDGDDFYKLMEFKNWEVPNSISGDYLSQFKAYLSSGHSFEYYFNNGLGKQMKGHFQTAIKNNIDDIWTSGKDYFKSVDIIRKNQLQELVDSGELINHEALNFVK